MFDDTFFVLFILAHLTGDFVLQTGKIAGLKSRKLSGVLLHVCIVAAVQMLMLSVFGLRGIAAGLAVGFIHFFIDWLKLGINKFFYRFQTAYFILDQFMHFIVIYMVSAVVTGALWSGLPLSGVNLPYFIPLPADTFLKYEKLAVIAILALFSATVTVKTIVRDIYPSLKKKVFFAHHERLTDTAAVVLLFCAACPVVFRGITLITIGVGIAFGAMIFALYFVLHGRTAGYTPGILITKFLAYAVVAVLLCILTRNTLISVHL